MVDEPAHTVFIDGLERVGIENTLTEVVTNEAADVVTAETECHLCQVVSTEGEEFGFFSDVTCADGSTGDFDHGTDHVVEIHNIVFGFDFFCDFGDDGFLMFQFVGIANNRDHHFSRAVETFFAEFNNRFQDGACLHGGDFRIGDTETDTAVPHHRVAFLQIFCAFLEFFQSDADGIGKILLLFFCVGDEFMQRRVEEADRDRFASHCFQCSFDILFHEGEQIVDSSDTFFNCGGKDHLTQSKEGLFSTGTVEHVFCTEKTDTFSAEFCSLNCVSRSIRIGAYAERTVFIQQSHELLEARIFACIDGGNCAFVCITACTVQADNIAFFVSGTIGSDNSFCSFVDLQSTGTDDTAFTPAAADKSCMAGHTAASGKNTVGCTHTFHVFRIGFFADEDAGDFLFLAFDCFFGCEDDLTDSTTGTCGETFHEFLGSHCFFSSGVKNGMEQFIKLVGRNAHDGFGFCDPAFFEHIHSHGQSGSTGTFANAALEHIEFLFLNGEFNIQHVTEMIFESVTDADEFFVDIGQNFLHGCKVFVLFVLCFIVQRVRCTGTGNHVFTLCIDQPFTVEFVIAGSGVTCECNTGSRAVAHVTEDHTLHVDSSTPVIRNTFDAAVGNSFFTVPAFEDSTDSTIELSGCIIGEFFAEDFDDFLFEDIAEIFEIIDIEIGISCVIFGFFVFFQDGIELFADTLTISRFDVFCFFHNNVRIHHDQTAVCVINETFVVCAFDQAGDCNRRKTDVENGFHHTGHGASCAGTAGNEQRVFLIAVNHTHVIFDSAESFCNLFCEAIGVFTIVFEIFHAAFGCDCETGGNRKTQVSHFSEVCTFTAEEFFHGGITICHALTKKIDVLFHFL